MLLKKVLAIIYERNSRRAGPIFGLHEDFPYNYFVEKLDPYQKNIGPNPQI